ncbi:hypothetical protein SCLARK_001341 [Spiroplasma clarkii]|uniref:hypothetical protein n=1 Tax=Spiroplasma clarkii TaxID=2139 RepID=UPI000B57B4B7|nr:hypothetical protein [Spiroplasma clarkii]ARU91339.1 hypothetical protein SCLARK_00681 [Spiroplasma clarkii]ARU91614.1 hypothetical protein SCLARK_001026 [Spiroplasma clarkii]ARU91874.1 hypothetical protein SCLARK_001341 [Spiroplasma clarkii]
MKQGKPRVRYYDHDFYLNIEQSFIDSGKTYGCKRIAIDLLTKGIAKSSHKKYWDTLKWEASPPIIMWNEKIR